MTFRLRELYAWVVLDARTDQEGVGGVQTEQGWVPLVGGDVTRAVSLRGPVELLRAAGHDVKLRRFVMAEEVLPDPWQEKGQAVQ